MMESIDKLRKWSHSYDNAWVQKDGSIMITTNTDGVYHGENYGEAIRQMIDDVEEEIAERYMELPTDADGVPIRVGEHMRLDNGHEGETEVGLMSITDELREWAHGFNGPWRRNEEMLLAIADRIDAEHERAVMSAMNDALYHANDESMAELGCVRLPKDADGVPFRIGDKVSSDHYDNGTVIAIQYGPMVNGSIRELVAVRPHGWDTATWHDPEEYRHHNTPTVEDVLREFVERWHDTHHDDIPALFDEYAAKLRLAEGEDA